MPKYTRDQLLNSDLLVDTAAAPLMAGRIYAISAAATGSFRLLPASFRRRALRISSQAGFVAVNNRPLLSAGDGFVFNGLITPETFRVEEWGDLVGQEWHAWVVQGQIYSWIESLFPD